MTKHPPILLVDDNEAEELLVSHALKRAGVKRELIMVRTAEEAMDYLSGKGPYADRERYPMPAVVLLDMRMPGMDGFDVLVWRQKQPQLADLPLLAYTNSTAVSDIQRISQLGAQDYLLKPHDPYALMLMMKRIATRWLGRPPELARAGKEPAVGRGREKSKSARHGNGEA